MDLFSFSLGALFTCNVGIWTWNISRFVKKRKTEKAQAEIEYVPVQTLNLAPEDTYILLKPGETYSLWFDGSEWVRTVNAPTLTAHRRAAESAPEGSLWCQIGSPDDETEECIPFLRERDVMACEPVITGYVGDSHSHGTPWPCNLKQEEQFPSRERLEQLGLEAVPTSKRFVPAHWPETPNPEPIINYRTGKTRKWLPEQDA